MKKFIIPILIAGGIGLLIETHAAVVKGRVLGSGSLEPVPGAMLKLSTLPDSTYVKGTATDLEGLFSIDSIKPGRYTLQPESFGLTAAPLTIRIKDLNDTLNLPDIEMRDESTMLSDLTVTGYRAAVTTKQDTLEFNAGSFKTKQNAVVEDLLKKLPGVEVGTDGAITSNGKSISKILVDGEEFFSDDPKVASKNLPSDMVEKVQVIDRKSDLARLTGVDDGEEETVINLTVKKGMKTGWFGNVSAGYGTDSRYNFGFNINRFVGNNQFTFLGGTNNVNDMTFTDMGRSRFRGFSGGNDGITTNRSLGFNFAVGNSEKLRVGGNLMYTYTDLDYHRQRATQYLFPDSTSYQNSENWSRNKGHNVRADLRLQWKMDEYNTLEFRPRFSYNRRDIEQSDTSVLRAGNPTRELVNRQDNFQNNKGDSYEFNGELIYSHKFKSRQGRQLSFRGTYNFSDTKEKGTSWSDITYYLMQDDSEQLYRFIDNHQWSNSVGARLTWTEPIGDPSRGNFFNVAYNFSYKFNNADKLTYNVPFEDEMTQQLFKSLQIGADDGTLDTDLSNQFRNHFMSQELQLSYKKVHSLYNLEAGLVFTPSMSKSTNLLNSMKNVPERWTWNYAPFMRFRYKFSKTRNLRLNYRARTSAPSITQLQPVADESDPLHITVGNKDLKPTFTQTLRFNYSDFNSDNQSNLMVMLNASHSLNSIVSRTVSDKNTGVQTTTYANVNNAFSVMGGTMYNRPFFRNHWRVSGEVFVNYSNSPGYINGDLNRSSNLNVRPRLGLTYTMDLLQISLRPQYGWQYTHNTLPMQPNRTVHSYGFSGDAELTLPFGLELATDIDFSKTSGYASGYDSSQWLWNAQLSYSFLKSRSLTVALKVYDILQQKNAISRNVGATSIYDERTNCLTRYAMLTLTYRFQTFSGKREQQMPDGFDGPGPGMGGPGPGAGAPGGPGMGRGMGGMRPH